MEVVYSVCYNTETGLYTYVFLDDGWWAQPMFEPVLGESVVTWKHTTHPRRVYIGDVIITPEPLNVEECLTKRRFDE